jgi:Ca-activated chloride channel family protein
MRHSPLLVALCAVGAVLTGGCGEASKDLKVARRVSNAGSLTTPKLRPPAVNASEPASVASSEKTPPPAKPEVAVASSPDQSASPAMHGFNTETYDAIVENPFLAARQNPLSTFSIDVDTASYALVRRFLKQGLLPPAGAVRIEELVNYFPYHYAKPLGDVPFAVNVELADCPWNPKHRLARIGLKGRDVHHKERPASNLVFLIDVSGSMSDENKLPLVKSSLKMLVERLGEADRVAIVVYAGESGLVLPSTSALDRSAIVAAIDQLSAQGSTNAGEGIQLAYKVATANFIKNGTNRVILCTDGDFNVGITDQGELIRLIEDQARGGVFLTVLGFGVGNYKDSTMEKLADKGNGNYAYIDNQSEAKKVLVDQLSGTLVTIAKDVKIQVDFNPARAAGYRLIGYENRLLRSEDFKNDQKDAGEIGAGHTVTAFYEVVPAGQPVPGTDVDPSKYQTPVGLAAAAAGPELFTIRLRYKEPTEGTSKPLDVPVNDQKKPFASASDDYRFAASVAQFGMLLRDSKNCGNTDFDAVLEAASTSIGADRSGYRAEFLELVKTARSLHPSRRTPAVGTLGANIGAAYIGHVRDEQFTRAPMAPTETAQPQIAQEKTLSEAGSRPLDLLLRVAVLFLLIFLLLRPNYARSPQVLDVRRFDSQR